MRCSGASVLWFGAPSPDQWKIGHSMGLEMSCFEGIYIRITVNIDGKNCNKVIPFDGLFGIQTSKTLGTKGMIHSRGMIHWALKFVGIWGGE